MRERSGAGSRTRRARTCVPGSSASSRTSTSTEDGASSARLSTQPLEEGDYFLYNRMEQTTRRTSTEERIDQSSRRTRSSAALSAVPHDFRDVIVLVDIGDFTYADAAQILDIPVGTVMSRLHRGRRILKRELAERVGA